MLTGSKKSLRDCYRNWAQNPLELLKYKNMHISAIQRSWKMFQTCIPTKSEAAVTLVGSELHKKAVF
jgi:hypothetical protein